MVEFVIKQIRWNLWRYESVYENKGLEVLISKIEQTGKP